MNTHTFIKTKYKEGYAVNAIVRMLKDCGTPTTDEKVKAVLKTEGIEFRPKSAETKKYVRKGRFEHLK